MKGPFFLLIFTSFFSATLSAQIMKSGGELVDAVDGNTLVTFTDSTSLYSEIEDPLWYSISKRIAFDEDDLNADSTLSEGVELYDYEGNPIGTVKATIAVTDIFNHTGFRMSSFQTGIIKGFASKFDTYPNSRAENAIEDMMTDSRRVNARELVPKLKTLGFVEEESNGMTVWVLRNSDEENSEFNEFPFRVLVIMRGGNNIQCVVTTTEKISSSSEREYYKERGRHFTWMTTASARNRETINNIVYEYLPL